MLDALLVNLDCKVSQEPGQPQCEGGFALRESAKAPGPVLLPNLSPSLCCPHEISIYGLLACLPPGFPVETCTHMLLHHAF